MIKKKHIINCIIPVIFFVTGILVSQNDLERGISLINNDRFQEGIDFLKKTETLDLLLEDKALKSFFLGYAYSNIDRQDLAYKSTLDAKRKYIELNKDDDLKDCNLQLLKILQHQNNLHIDKVPIIDELYQYAKKKNDPDIFFSIYREIASNYLDEDRAKEALNEFRKSYKLSKSIGDSIQISFDEMNIGTTYQKYLNNIDSGLFYAKRSIKYLIKIKDSLNIAYNYNNQAEAYKDLGNYNQAEYYYKKADSINIKSNINKSKAVLYKNLKDLYSKKKDYKNAYLLLEKLNALKDSINDTQQNIAISNIKEQYDNEKLRADNLEQENNLIEEKSQKKQITIALTSTLLLGAIIAFLVYRNTKRKQRIAEQDRELQIQKTETILKEKELETINAMVSGQEKERLRLAGELHDNLGSTLATVRMQVENLERNLDKVENPKALLQKTNALVNEAYDKVRAISHERNSGVMAKDGLLPAVEKLARTVSSTNGVTIDVQDFGLENRIPNELEITIFRIIQELVTNIVKHAEASEATISLTQHDNELNIIVEDNGKGFKVGKLEEKDGMGLGNIERRVEHLEGTMEVDSAEGRGTSVSIDIPLQ